jgi:hypothetical protein
LRIRLTEPISKAMRRVLFLWGMCVLLVAGAGPLRAAEMRASKPDVRQEVVKAIEGQLTAFRRGEVEQAYRFAAAELRAQKPLPAFAAIVQGNYPEIWANRRAEFGIVRDDGTRATVTVQVYAKKGDAAYDYTLIKERPGWRIYGVVRHAPRRGGKA